MDVFFLAYANNERNPLPSLDEEYDDVYGTLVDNYVTDSYQIHPDLYADVERINVYLKKFRHKISLFHYSGHADRDHVFLGDYPAHADGLIDQLEDSARAGVLKLVVLNGCCTAGNVQKLLSKGVPAVIATSALVYDKSAKEFAKRFYKALFEESLTIRQAYEEALKAAQLGNTGKQISMQKS